MKKFLLSLCLLVLTLLVFCGISAFAIYEWASSDLPEFTRLSDYTPPQATTILARDGSLMGTLYNEKRYVIPLSEMSPWLPKALLAVEDADFYSHKGVDPLAIMRAFLANLKSGRHTQGGSTITQQVIKRLILTSERTYERKLKEAVLAYRLEKYLSKDEILAIYLNQAFLGAGAYGAEAAARTYFGKHAKELSLAESALIAGLPQAPTAYNPLRHFEASKSRQLHVLNRMLEVGMITLPQYEEARREELRFQPMPEGGESYAAWYIEEVRRQLSELFNSKNAKALGLKLPFYGDQAVTDLGLTVRTAMVPSMQQAADTALKRGLEAADRRHGWHGPLAHLSESEIEKFCEEQAFSPELLANGEWVKAVVSSVRGGDIQVRMGVYRGVIASSSLSWAHRLNAKAAAAGVKSLRTVVAPGDVVWVSALPSSDSKSKEPVLYDPKAQRPDKPIALRLQQMPEVQGALVSMEAATGDVVALCGGYSFKESQFNRATQARRQPGSSFKPVVYSAALDAGMTPISIVMDTPLTIVDQHTGAVWKPMNFEKGFRGALTLRTALALSRNLCSVRLAQQIGIKEVIKRAKELGLTSDFPPYLSISLGAVEVVPMNMAEAYTAFANGGKRARARLILEVRDSNGRIIYAPEPQITEAITPQNAYLMSYMLKQVVEAGTATRAKVLKRPLAGKTGTSNDMCDAWFMGFTPSLVTATYVGYDQPRSMGRQETGTFAALPIFIDYSEKVFPLYPPDDFAMPSGITTAFVDKNSGYAAVSGDPNGITVPFYEGSGPNKDSSTAGSAVTREESDMLFKELF